MYCYESLEELEGLVKKHFGERPEQGGEQQPYHHVETDNGYATIMLGGGSSGYTAQWAASEEQKARANRGNSQLSIDVYEERDGNKTRDGFTPELHEAFSDFLEALDNPEIYKVPGEKPIPPKDL